MPNQTPAEQEDTLITLEGDDGQSYACQLVDVFEFENQEYALLLKSSANGSGAEKEQGQTTGTEEGSLVVMRLTQRDEQCIFQTIEDDKEFERVINHIEELAQESLNEADEHEDGEHSGGCCGAEH